MLSHTLCYAILYGNYVILYDAILCYGTLCYAMLYATYNVTATTTATYHYYFYDYQDHYDYPDHYFTAQTARNRFHVHPDKDHGNGGESGDDGDNNNDDDQ